jgi:hypothetical protein
VLRQLTLSIPRDVQRYGCTRMGRHGQLRQLEYQANGLALRGTVAVPDGAGPFPGVLIGHEGPGLDDVQRARAADIAKLGYVGFALDYHGQHSPFADRSAMIVLYGGVQHSFTHPLALPMLHGWPSSFLQIGQDPAPARRLIA